MDTNDIASAFKKILNKKEIDLETSFFKQGGNSLLALKLMNLINSTHKTDLRLNEVFKNSSVKELTHLLKHKEVDEDQISIDL